MSENNIRAKGGCMCGAIKIEIDGEPLRMAKCHCRDCQRASGTGHMPLVFMREQDVNIEGEASDYAVTTDSGNISTRSFCPTCGSRVYGRNSARPGVIGIPVGIFEERSWFRPSAVVYCRSRDEWDVTDEDIPNFETMPPA